MKERLFIYNITLIALIIGYFVIDGAEVFGHIVVNGTAFEEPPAHYPCLKVNTVTTADLFGILSTDHSNIFCHYHCSALQNQSGNLLLKA